MTDRMIDIMINIKTDRQNNYNDTVDITTDTEQQTDND